MNQVAACNEYGLVAVSISGQIKWCAMGDVAGSAAIVRNGTVDYVR